MACQGRGVEHTKLGGKNEKRVTYSSMHKNATCLLCCACAANVWAGGLRGWLEVGWMWWNLAECDVENRAVLRDQH